MNDVHEASGGHGADDDPDGSDTTAQASFLAQVAHELRNLVAPISNAAHLIKLRGADAAAREPALAMIERQVHEMTRLCERLSTAGRLLRADTVIETRPLVLAEIVEASVAAVQPQLDADDRRLLVTPPPAHVRVRGSAEQLRNLLTDLLDNAIRFSADGGRVWLAATHTRAAVRITVRDEGAGMSPALLERVFEPFAARTGAAQRAGLGLSLALARRVAELHDGTLDAASAGPGQGTTFTLTLPALHGEQRSAIAGTAAAPAAAEVAHGRAARKQILVVDDSSAVRESLAGMLEEMGHAVRVAADGAQAFEILRDWRPQYVLLDIRLPGEDGYAIARRLRARYAAPEMVLIMMSGESMGSEMARGAAAAGFDFCMDKMQAAEQLEPLLGGRCAPAGGSLPI